MTLHRSARSIGRVGGWVLFGVCAFASPRAIAQSLTVSGSPGLLRVNAAVAGNAPTAVSNNSTSYTTRTTGGSGAKKITARLSSNMPAGTTLTITMAATTGATSLGAITLNTTTQDVVQNITNTTNQTRAITYNLTATAAAGVINSTPRTVTLTLTNYP
jgi:hypothetical protein